MQIAKLLTLLFYVVAVVAWQTSLFGDASPYIYYTALAFPAFHILEIPVAYKYLDRHPGGMAQSILLTVVFGVGHWLPLKKEADRALA
ncbi:hypothetical protein IB286_01875 [Spongiibacter sp. KMU-158]|uniref:Uncharacterized protein n=1 Tax=Spongiibacter pelagi TaxID=2760804 RepID=A0A927C0F1_9GAMM|nr:hypothetical protein [Spongiibacter pelagi]MBD2857737.1 hypothetical protein [Spongiibacter pelagi]